MFKPSEKKKIQPKVSRAKEVICLIIGTDRKEKFKRYCDKTKTSQTEMIKQMIDYCINNSE